ncbi:hypothetical protein BN961_00300 [Afipia felis]|uniref:WYL domain-containing protein n=1 Tax=Afipia felis TaxID=1035 RepID=A0A090MH72_AFIFE|nr:hypothetical protein BN961_00300 [Afipia felis]
MLVSIACEILKAGLQLRFLHNSQDRIVEIHTVGFSKKNAPIMRAWQVSGGSQSGSPTPWRIFQLDEVRDVKVLDIKSHAPRPGYRRGDPSIDRIVCEI